MIEEPKIKKMPPKRTRECYQTVYDILIPAGTILREAATERGGKACVEAAVGFGKDFTGNLVVQVHHDAIESGAFRAVIA